MKTSRRILIGSVLLSSFCVVFWLGYGWGRFREHLSAGEDIKVWKTRACTALLYQGLTNYFGTYGRWPCATNRVMDTTFGPGTQAEVMNALLGFDKTLNPGGKMFVSLFHDLYIGGEFVDAWTNALYITFDLDKDGKCYSPRWGAVETNGPLIWSEAVGTIRSW